MPTSLVDIIIPTYNNREFLHPCLISLLQALPNAGPIRVLVVNNGAPDSCDWIAGQPLPFVEVLQSEGKNLGWEGGLELGLARSTSPYVLFCNDDVVFPHTPQHWLDVLVSHFADPGVGAVGPTSNMVAGMQSLFAMPYPPIVSTKFLIGFCLLVRRSALEAVGGIDRTLPGGDDFDLSLRLRTAGYRLIADRRVFVFHHGYKTGERIHGTADQAGGWNSIEMRDATVAALIEKHGQAVWDDAMTGGWASVPPPQPMVTHGTNQAAFNPLDFPTCFQTPRLVTTSAWLEHIPFAFFLVAALRPSVIVELGTHYGASYCAFCQAVEVAETQSRCFAVDSWQGDAQSGFYGPEILADLRAYHDPLYGSFSQLIQGTFDEARDRFADGEVDLLHFDGNHTYEAVKHDFETWLPKMSQRGVILFHDIEIRYAGFGVWRLWEELSHSYRSFAFDHGHGLGLIFLGTEKTLVETLLFDSTDGGVSIRTFFAALGAQIQVAADLEALRESSNLEQAEIARLRDQLQAFELLTYTPVG